MTRRLAPPYLLGELDQRLALTDGDLVLLITHPAKAVLRLVLHAQKSLEPVPGILAPRCHLFHEVDRVAVVVGTGPLAKGVATGCIGRGYRGEDRSRDRRLAF
jgi:hypothetical protein